mmetsp:Transcript_38602/g.106296  ORF Transcript_38602/g.106296 Transcript_38602/m.106296 type:complete len:594 (-) Transcript_38602:102-1883(-)
MEHSSATSGVDQSLYPVALLIDELRHDDLQLRLRAIKNLGTIALALGPERTRDELLPFLQEITDDDEEVLGALAEQLARGVPWVGGAEHASALLGPLEELCKVEELSVREKATEALKELAKQMSAEQAGRHIIALVGRLASHEWFTARISVCSLFAAALPNFSGNKQDDLLKTYMRLCGDDAPMVRRQAANVLGSVAQVLQEESMLDELVDVFETLSKDEQDSVRILAINNCIALGKLRGSPQWREQLLGVIRTCSEDKSWRVRYMAADHVKEICEVFKEDAKDTIVPLYLKLLADQEVEVRTIAAARIAAVSSLRPTKEFLETLICSVEKLTSPKEQSQHVRASLAGCILSLVDLFGRALTVEHLINIILQLLRDESPEVRLKFISTLGELSSLTGIEVLSQTLLPSIKELGKDRQWRVRLGIIDCMPKLAKHLGEKQFTTELSGLFITWLMDPVYSVREAAAQNFRQLSEVLGTPWFETNIMPQLNNLLVHKNYLYRISAVISARTLAEVAGGPFLEKHLVPLAVKMAADPVPNVRFNTAKAIHAMQKSCEFSSAAFESSLLPCLWRLVADADPDVKFFANRAIAELGIQK